jgi:hypothetical protein
MNAILSVFHEIKQSQKAFWAHLSLVTLLYKLFINQFDFFSTF